MKLNPSAERRLMHEHGTRIAQLPPSAIVHCAVSDLRLKEKKARGEAGQREHYAFHRRHVAKAKSEAELLSAALRGRQAGTSSGKLNTRLLYENEALLRSALELAAQGSAA